MEHIESEQRQVPQPSYDTKDAMKALHGDTKKKISNRYAKVIRYGELKKNLPENLKISPVSMITQKS